jgi:hypothetical protein
MSTTIKLKKSGETGNTPTSGELEYGEIALNYADGILYYKDATNNISQISGTSANTFETINANGTLVIADSNTDILSINSGDGIDVIGDGLSDTITINVRFNDTVTSNNLTEAATANAVKTAYDLANTANITAALAYDAANNRVLKAGDTMTGQLNISSGGLLVTGNVGIGITSPTSNLHVSGTANITSNLFSGNIVSTGTITETVNGVQYLVASAFDVGTAPNQIPLNQYLGTMAYQDSEAITINNLTVTGDYDGIIAGGTY